MVLGIDLGSNTMRAVVMDDDFKITFKKEAIIGAARDLSDGQRLKKEAKEKVILFLSELKKDINISNDYIAVATEAFRMASDGKEFFEEIYKIFGIKFIIIDGISEAKFTRCGIEHRLKELLINSHNTLVIDLGGGSTEISCNNNFKSFKFGIIRFFNEFDMNIDSIKERADLITKDAREFISNLKFNNIVLTAGVPTSIVALKKDISYEDYDANLINGELLHYDDFKFWLEKAKTMTKEEAKFKLGINRGELVIAGIIILISLLQNYTKMKFLVVDDGLREGLCVAYLENKINTIIKDIK